MTLTAAGGSGKTRLCLEAARTVENDFADGACFVGLAPLADPDLVTSALAQALGLEETSLSPRRDLIAFLRTKELLLPLDNFEHLLPAAPLISELLSSSEGLAVLVTSRSPLHLSGEQVYPVPPLEIPEQSSRTLAEVADSEAAWLFVARAHAMKPGFSLTSENAAAVAEICRRLDGLPLAIELAAARIVTLPPQALRDRLEQRLKLLTGGARDLPVRQRTLRDAIAWSHELLNPAEQTLFRRLAVFAGGCTLEAVETVCQVEGNSVGDELDLMASLVDKSLVSQAEQEDGEPRFGMLETIREFAWERLRAGGEAEAIQAQHAAYYLHVAEARDAVGRGEGTRWLFRREADLDNLRAALSWSTAVPERAESGLRLAAALYGFWELRGYWAEGRYWLGRALAHADGVSPAVLATALMIAGNGAFFQDELATARGYLERSLAIWRQQPSGVETAFCLRSLARVTLSEDDPATARALCEEALAIATSLGARMESAIDLNVLANISRRQGDLLGARACIEKGLGICREEDFPTITALLVMNLAWMLTGLDALDEARALFEESLDIGRRTGDRKAIARCLCPRPSGLHRGRRPGRRSPGRAVFTLAVGARPGLPPLSQSRLGQGLYHPDPTALRRLRAGTGPAEGGGNHHEHPPD